MRLVYSAVIAALSFTPLSSNAQSLLGSSVTVVGRYPSITSAITRPATATVGPGIEFTHLDVIGGSSVPVTFDLGVSVIDLGFGYSYSGSHASFDGPVFTFASLSNAITGVTVNPSSSSNYNQIIVGWSSNEIAFNFAQISGLSPGANFRFDVSVSPVPEPNCFALGLLGLLALGSKSLFGKSRRRGDA